MPAQSDSRRVVAAVVTFNRLELLQTLVASLRATPRLTAIVVVDNASTDGTGEWLRVEADRAGGVPVLPVTLPENRGEQAASTKAYGARSPTAPTLCG